MYKKLYNKLILEVDAQDNGVSVAESTRYNISTHLGSRGGTYVQPKVSERLARGRLDRKVMLR
jgi:hypothetical protein